MLVLTVVVLAVALTAVALSEGDSDTGATQRPKRSPQAKPSLRPKSPAQRKTSPPPKLQPVTDGVPQPTNLAFDRGGRLWISSAGYKPAEGDGVWFLSHPRAKPTHVVTGLPGALGLVWVRGTLFVSHLRPDSVGTQHRVGQVTAFSGFDGRGFAHRRVVVDDIPTGLHSVDSLAARQDGRIFLSVGSRTDSEPPAERLSASVISFKPDGSDLRVAARGLRNPYGLAFLPDRRTLAISDEGRDDLGLDQPPEELNVQDTDARPADFGFPRCYGQGGSACAGTRRARVRMPAHAAASGVAVAEGFGSLGPSAFVALFGSTFDKPPTGGEVVRIPLHGGRPSRRAVPFARDVGSQEPLGLAMGPDQRLYVTLWKSGRVAAISPPRGTDPRG
jgi:glucose/arabinose dehydrogenase